MNKKFSLYINDMGFCTMMCSNSAVEVANNINVKGFGYIDEELANTDSKKLQKELNKVFGNNRYKVSVREGGLMRPKEVYIVFPLVILLTILAYFFMH